MSDFKIEKNIPMPVKRRKAKYPFDALEIGDSFFVPFDAGDEIPANNRIRSACTARSKNGKSFSCKRAGAGTRVWRVE